MPIGAPVYRLAGTNWTLGGANVVTCRENGYAVLPNRSSNACCKKATRNGNQSEQKGAKFKSIIAVIHGRMQIHIRYSDEREASQHASRLIQFIFVSHFFAGDNNVHYTKSISIQSFALCLARLFRKRPAICVETYHFSFDCTHQIHAHTHILMKRVRMATRRPLSWRSLSQQAW